jgi:predicted metal-binding protein
MTGFSVTIFVCVSCRRSLNDDESYDLPGAELVPALRSRLKDAGAEDVTVTPVECLAVCKRPCTVAVTAQEKWVYIIGDLDPAQHADEVVEAALAYQRSEDGIVPWKERPPTFRKGVVARLPPRGFTQPETETA